MNGTYADRRDAGRTLAAALDEYADREDVQLLALPRGGVAVAAEVARRLRLPLDVLIVRKLGVPWQPELAVGAIASGDVTVWNQDMLSVLDGSEREIEEVVARERAELERRERAYRGDRPFPLLRGRTVVLVDDGLATGSTMLAAIRSVARREPARVVVAVPVAPPETVRRLEREADEVVCPLQPADMAAIGSWYQDFPQLEDDEVRRMLRESP